MEIENYPNYLIYPDGRVYSKQNDKFLRPGLAKAGYYTVGLYKDGKRKTHTVHRLVAMHYIPNPENKREIDHMNRDKSDNRVENLRWATKSENLQNRKTFNTNTSGHTNISYDKLYNGWVFRKDINKKVYRRCFKSKIDCLCYKFIFLMINN